VGPRMVRAQVGRSEIERGERKASSADGKSNEESTSKLYAFKNKSSWSYSANFRQFNFTFTNHTIFFI
jgi:hypothetical protein